MKEFLEIFKTTPIFSGLEDDDILNTLEYLNAGPAAFNKGEAILRRGDVSGSMGLILSGQALVSQSDYWGNQNLIAKIDAGHIFAESFACLPNSILTVDVTAGTDCRIIFMELGRLMSASPDTPCLYTVVKNLLALMAGKNLYLNAKLTHMGQRSTREKLLSYLSAQALNHGSGEFDIGFNRQQLADYLSVDRSAMSNELCRLRDEGFLSFHKNHFTLLKSDIG